jgi:repressor LexA
MTTDSQRKTYNFISHFIDQHGYAPKLPEIAKGIGITSKGTVHRYVQDLIKEGLLECEANRHRGIRLVVEKRDQAANQEIPLLGKIAAGEPIEAIQESQPIALNDFFYGNNLYALQVKGDSMIDAGILDGDLVICEQRAIVKDGDIVVALIDQCEATLKAIKRNLEEKTITLIPYNARLKPITYAPERITIQGKFKALLRKTL